MIERFQLQTDAVRAFHGVVAFAVPLFICHWLNLPTEGLFISMAALNLSLPDLRGAYGIRLSILATMTLVAAASAFLGVTCAGSLVASVVGMGVIALMGGWWRHLSGDYGPALAVSSGLLFLLGLGQPGGAGVAWHLSEYVWLGGVLAALLHASFWFIRPQHGLRYAVAETWVGASDLVAAMRPTNTPDKSARGPAVAKQERELRVALDRTFVVLGAEKNPKYAPLLAHLEEVRREVVHLTMRLIAFNASLEPMVERPEFAGCLPVLDSVLKAVGDAVRSVALSLILHRAENFSATKVRLRRCRHLIKALDEQLSVISEPRAELAQLRSTLAQVDRVLPRIHEVLQETVEHGVRRHDFSASLPDISARSIKSLAAWIRPASEPDPVLVRYVTRLAAFTMLAVALYKAFDIPRGYWIAFTILVVLQPDYGSTRQRAVERISGTVAGGLLASLFLWINLPLAWLDGLAAVTAFAFGYYLKRSYGTAIFFVTINLVLTAETLAPVHTDFMVLRVFCNLLGGGLALIAARVLWPVWEGEQYPALLATAIRSNKAFLEVLFAGAPGPGEVQADLLMAKRRAENANRFVAASVERLLGEPVGLQEMPERAAALATYNQRVTRALTVLAVQLPAPGPQSDPLISLVTAEIAEVLESLALTVEPGEAATGLSKIENRLRELEARFCVAGGPSGQAMSPECLVRFQLAKTIAEIRAMSLALEMDT